ncbi:MAG: hypothetical protein IPM81_12985 [Saprospirales bacterium]|nr:hypothetical protein [Saprospirales bacterium]
MDKLQHLEHTLHHLRSPKRAHTFWGLLAVLAVCFGLIWLKHGQWLNSPNQYMLGNSPDSFKNYMTSLWHVRHDSSYVHYEGMNYPYGEHVLFTDNQPLLSAAMQWWSRHVDDLRGKTTSVINVFQVISLLLGCGVLFLLLRKLHVPVWYAGLVALGMVFLNPQFGRFDAHFALSHTWVFPLLLLLLNNYEERYSRRYQSLQIGVLLWVAAQLHFYYFGLGALFLILYTAFQLMLDPSLRNWRVRFSHLVVMVLLPFALLNGWIHWADYASDRPSSPYGFTTYIGEWEGVFLPYENFPLFQWIDQHLVSIRRVNGEAKAYAGAVSFFFTLWLLVSGFRMFGKSWGEAAYHRVHKRYLQGIFFAAVVLLVFACGFPFAIKGMEWMVDYMGPLRQFRGLGRFTWVYFYVINVLAFYALWNWSVRFKGFRDGRMPWFRWVAALAPAGLLLWEGYTLQRLHTFSFMENLEKRGVAAPAAGHWLNKVDFSPYQALLPLPYYHIGSENTWLQFDYLQFIRTQTTALHTGLPDMGVNMSRTSCNQTVNSVQFVLEPGRMPAMLNELPDNRPLAVMVHGPAWDDVRRRYPHLVDKATPVYDSPEMKILSVTPDSIRSWVRAHIQAVEQERNSRVLERRQRWQVSTAANPFFYQSFDSLQAPTRNFQGGGAFSGNMRDTTWLWRDPLPKGQYVMSFWMYVNQDLGMNHELRLFENDPGDGHEIQFRHEGMRFHLKSIVGGWGLFELPFEVRQENSRLQVFLFKAFANQSFFLDELLLRPQQVDMYRREAGWVVRNNYWYNL